MFQKEMADRILAKVNSKNYGRLSILSNWKFDIKKLFDINPSSFEPKPKVESSLLFFSEKVTNLYKLDCFLSPIILEILKIEYESFLLILLLTLF